MGGAVKTNPEVAGSIPAITGGARGRRDGGRVAVFERRARPRGVSGSGVDVARRVPGGGGGARVRIEEMLRREGAPGPRSVREPHVGGGSRSKTFDVGDSVPGSITIPRDVRRRPAAAAAVVPPSFTSSTSARSSASTLAPDWSPPLHGRREQKRLLRTYQRAFHSMRRWWPSEREWDDDAFAARRRVVVVARGSRAAAAGAGGGSPLAAFFGGLGISSLPGGVFGASSGEDGGSDAGGSDDDVRDRRVHYEVCDDHVLLGCVGSDFELYVALDPLTRRSAAVAVCNRLCAWLRAEEADSSPCAKSPTDGWMRS